MNPREIAFVFAPTKADEAKGVLIQRAIGGERLAILDPFLLLDHVTVDTDNTSDVIGFPRHPHRGIETLSYVIRGSVAHRDSLGNEGEVGPGGSQWMTAGNGIFHEEMLRPDATGGEFLQLWFSLPRAQKRIPPAYVGAPGETIPVVGGVRVVSGSYGGVTGPFVGIAVDPIVLDASLASGESLELPAEAGKSAFVYLVSGRLKLGARTIHDPHMIVLTDGDGVTVSAGAEGARFLFVCAQPLNEPILQYRSFVMNTPDDIRETLDMIGAGGFGV